MNTQAGHAAKRAKNGFREVVWTADWQSAKLSYESESVFGGRMEQVSGALYKDGKPVSTFRADRAEAYAESNRLKLTGHVQLLSKDPVAAIVCDVLLWDAGGGVVKATSNVHLDALDYKAGPFAELWATPKLDVFSTPSLFPKLVANGSKTNHAKK